MAVPDFRKRTPNIAPDAIANVLQRRRQLEEQQRQFDKQRKDQRFMNAIQLGQNLANSFLTASEKRRERERVDQLAAQAGEEAFPTPTLNVEGRTVTGQLSPQDSRQRSLVEALVRQAPDKFAEAQFKALAPTPQGTPPRSVQGIFVDQFNRGLITEEQLKRKLQEFDPDVSIVKDSEGNQFVYDRRTQTRTPLTQPKAAPETGKEKRIQFTPREQEQIQTVKDAIRKDAVLNEDRALLNKADNTRRLIVQNQPGAVGFIRTQLAKAAGEQRITDADIDRFSGSTAIKDRARRWYQAWKEGNLTEVDKEDYLAMLDVAEEAAANRLAASVDAELSGLEFDLTNPNMEAVRSNIAPGLSSAMKRIAERKAKQAEGPVFESPEAIKAAPTEELKARLKKLQGAK